MPRLLEIIPTNQSPKNKIKVKYFEVYVTKNYSDTSLRILEKQNTATTYLEQSQYSIRT